MSHQSLPRLTHLAFAISAIFSGAAFAQTAAPAAPAAPAPVSAPKADSMQKVEITGSQAAYDPRKDDTASKIVVTAEEILKHGDTTLGDVLKRQPGVTVSGGNMGRGGGEIRMRGLGSGYTQILLNGEPAPPGFSIDSLTPEMVERIEIVRSATAEFSTQAIAGTINIVLKSRVTVAQREAKFNLNGADTFIAQNATLQVSDKKGPLSYSITTSVNVGRFNQDSYQLDEGFNPAGQQTLLRRGDRHGEGNFQNFSFSPRLIYTLSPSDTLTSQTFLNLNRVKPQNENHWTAFIGSLPAYPTDRSQVQNSQDNFRTDLNWVKKIQGGAKLDTKIGFNANRRISDFAQQGYDVNGKQTLDNITPGTARENGLTFTGKYSTPLLENHTLATGWDLGGGHRSETRLQIDRPIPGYVPAYVPLYSDEQFTADLRRTALFVQDEWNVTPKWSVYFGLRWEQLDTKTEGNHYSEVQNKSSVLSPLFQTLWKLPDSKNDQVRFALTRTYKAPGIDRLIPRRFTTTNNTATTPDNQGNPNLKPELATGIDTAFEHYFGPSGAMMSISAYARRIKDFTRRDVQLINGRWVAMPINDGTANTRGIELEAKFPLQLFWKEGPAIDVRANLARNWSSVDSVPGPNNRLADQTPLSANFGLDYKLNQAISMGGTYTFKTGGPIRVSEQNSTFATVKRELDIYAQWKFDAKMQLRVSAINVLGQDFVFIEEYRDASGLMRNTGTFPVSPMLRAQLEIKF